MEIFSVVITFILISLFGYSCHIQATYKERSRFLKLIRKYSQETQIVSHETLESYFEKEKKAFIQLIESI